MKERMRRILCCMGTAGVMTVMMAVPAMAADVTEDNQNIEVMQEAEQTETARTREERATAPRYAVCTQQNTPC